MNVDKDTLLMWSHFRDYKFYEAEHYYTFKGERVGTSVTQFVGSKCKPFDTDMMSKYVAEKQGGTQQDVLDEWKRNADIACTLGTMFHLRSELLAQGKEFEFNFSEAESLGVREEVETKLKELVPMQDQFFDTIKDRLIPLKTEFTVGLDNYIAGNIDLLAYNVKTNKIDIVDYKTNKKIEKTNKFGKKMLDEFSDLPDCELAHYSVQLNIYKEILERKIGIKIGQCYIVWFNAKNEKFELMECWDVQDRVKTALDNLITKGK